MSLSVPLQTQTNVRDVLAPLFCNGRSFSSLIDELSKHFKFEPLSTAYDGDGTGVLEASSESQSTDSEGEGNASDEADYRLVQARVSAQGGFHTNKQAASAADAETAPAAGQQKPSAALMTTATPPPSSPATAASTHPDAAVRHAGRTTRSRTQGRRLSTPPPLPPVPPPPPPPSPAHTVATASDLPDIQAGGAAVSAGIRSGLSSAALASGGRGKSESRGGGGGGGGRPAGGSSSTGDDDDAGPSIRGETTRPAVAGNGVSGGNCSAAGGTRLNAKGFISGDVLTVLSVTANADGWSEPVGAALATRARAGYVSAQEVDPESPKSTEFVREVFVDERSGARKALEVRMRLIAAHQKVLLCSAWVDSGEYLAAAARLVAQCQAEVFGIACVRFEQNPSTHGLMDRFNLYAKSMPKGSVPSVNMGTKNYIPASLTKALHGYTYNRGGGGRASGVSTAANTGKARNNGDCAGDDIGGDGVTDGSNADCGGVGNSLPAPAAAAAAGVEPKPDRARKRRRGRGAVADRDAESADTHAFLTPEVTAATTTTAVAAAVPPPAAVPEPMDEGKEGGLPAGPAADEVSAGEGLAEPGDGGKPAQRFGGGGVSEGTGGGGQLQLLGSAMFGEEEGEYAADSERSTDHESMHVYCGGGRESDEHEMSERDVFQRGGLRLGGGGGGGGGSGGGRRGRGRKGSARTGVRHGLRVGAKISTPEVSPDGNDRNSSSQYLTGAACGSRRGGASAVKRRRVGVGAGLRGRGGAIPDADDTGEEHSESRAHSEEASGSGGGDGDGRGDGGGGEEGHEGDVEDVEGGAGTDVDNRGEMIPGVELDWKAKQGRQPIFMSRGLPEENSGLPSHSEEGENGPGISGRGGGVGGMSLKSLPDPEDDRDRASSCSSAGSIPPPVVSRVGGGGSGGIVRLGPRETGGVGRVGVGEVVGGIGVAGGDSDDEGIGNPSGEVTVGGNGGVSRDASATINDGGGDGGGDVRLRISSPNSRGGVVPWHHTSVYEANNPTEDRHVELGHDALGVRIYCVCDGHGGSRAAQFVCDNLAGDVLARVLPIAERAHGGRRRKKGVRAGGADDDEEEEEEKEVRRTLAEAFSSCDERFIAQLDPRKNRGYINAGCCVVLALLIRSKLYVAHVGDCRVVLGTTDGARFSPNLLAATASSATKTRTHSAAAVAGAAATAMGGGGSGNRGDISDDRSKSGKTRAENGSAAVASKRGTSPMNPTSPDGTVMGGTGAGSVAGGGELVAVALSRDHNCDDADEVALVRARSGDENAIRVSRNDEGKGPRAIKRVAGSLAVTRAIGDAYLKEAVFSFSPYKEGVPYITAEPAITTLDLTPADRFLILATDGVWEQVTNDEAVQCVSATLDPASADGNSNGGSGNGSSPAMSRRQRSTAVRAASATSDALVNFVLARSAQWHGRSVPALRALPRGPSRRMLHDDVCATVVHFTPASPPATTP